MNLEVRTQKFNKEELATISRIIPFMGNVRKLKSFNQDPYTIIKQFLVDGVLSGYAVINFDECAYLEDIVYWGRSSKALSQFLIKIKNEENYPFPIEPFYYFPSTFVELTCNLLDRAGFERKTRTR